MHGHQNRTAVSLCPPRSRSRCRKRGVRPVSRRSRSTVRRSGRLARPARLRSRSSSACILSSARSARLVDHVPHLVRIGAQVVELVHALELDVVDVLPALRAHALVAHLRDAREHLVREVLDEERVAPLTRSPRSRGTRERPCIPFAFAAGTPPISESVGARSMPSTISSMVRPASMTLGPSHVERHHGSTPRRPACARRSGRARRRSSPRRW